MAGELSLHIFDRLDWGVDHARGSARPLFNGEGCIALPLPERIDPPGELAPPQAEERSDILRGQQLGRCRDSQCAAPWFDFPELRRDTE
jgi:hypothetical protein